MPIADSRFFTREHILAHHRSAPADLAELAVHCLELVAELADEGLQFRFKGGNSLLVLLEDPKRFSIDVDITTEEPRDAIDAAVESVVKRHGVFTRWQKRQHKTKPWLPMVSYEIFFRSQFAASGESFIMLDAVLHNTRFDTIQKTVACGDLFYCSRTCELPSISSMVGDKLLTLGPNTLGIPLGKKKEAQRLKHVYDVSLLARRKVSLGGIRRSIESCMAQENRIQEKAFTLAEVYEDTVRFCRLTAEFEAKPSGPVHDAALAEIVFGHEPFSTHLFDSGYSWKDLQSDAARAALCFAAVVSPAVSEDEFTNALKQADAASYWRTIDGWAGR